MGVDHLTWPASAPLGRFPTRSSRARFGIVGGEAPSGSKPSHPAKARRELRHRRGGDFSERTASGFFALAPTSRRALATGRLLLDRDRVGGGDRRPVVVACTRVTRREQEYLRRSRTSTRARRRTSPRRLAEPVLVARTSFHAYDVPDGSLRPGAAITRRRREGAPPQSATRADYRPPRTPDVRGPGLADGERLPSKKPTATPRTEAPGGWSTTSAGTRWSDRTPRRCTPDPSASRGPCRRSLELGNRRQAPAQWPPNPPAGASRRDCRRSSAGEKVREGRPSDR